MRRKYLQNRAKLSDRKNRWCSSSKIYTFYRNMRMRIKKCPYLRFEYVKIFFYFKIIKLRSKSEFTIETFLPAKWNMDIEEHILKTIIRICLGIYKPFFILSATQYPLNQKSNRRNAMNVKTVSKQKNKPCPHCKGVKGHRHDCKSVLNKK